MSILKWSKEFVYYLGFLWADGYVCRTSISLEICESDMIEVSQYFDKIDFIKFNTYSRKRDNYKPVSSIYFCNCILYDSFFNVFDNKSFKSASNLINLIPVEYTRYFFNGLIDGDGSFYVSKDKKTTQFVLSSSYDQDWSYMIYLFNEIDIRKYKINKVKRKNGNKYSYIRVVNYRDIMKIENYLYPNGFELGLKRKYDKCRDIIDNKPSYFPNNEDIEKELFIDKISNFNHINQACDYFNCSRKKIYNHCKKYKIIKDGFFQKKKKKRDEYMTLYESRMFMRNLSIKSKALWIEYCREGNRPDNIPSNPFSFYKNDGWISYGDWLGF